MIEYFTALVISYHLHGEPIDATIWLDSEARCETAMRGAGDLYETIYRLYGKDIMMRCHTSELVSKPLVRPQARPEQPELWDVDEDESDSDDDGANTD